MHSSRMRTAHSSGRHGGSPHTPWSRHPLPPWSRHPPGAGYLGAGTPWPDPPQLPPWVWAWRPHPGLIPLNCPPLGVGLEILPPPARSPSTSPLGVGLETCKVCWNTTQPHLETCCKACWDTTCNACWDNPPPPREQTHTCKNITFANYVCER